MSRRRRKGSRIGRTLLAVARGADRVGDGLERVFGKDMANPGDSFSRDRAGKRAASFTEKAKSKNQAGGLMDKNKDRKMFGKNSEEDDDRRFI